MVCEDCEVLAKRVPELEKRVAELETRLARYENAHTPPSLSNVSLGKVSSPKKRGGKLGRKEGHTGVGRKTPDDIHNRKKLKLKVCPHCGGKVVPKGKRKRTTTGLQPGQTVNTEYEIQKGQCKKCHKIVEPVVPEALPNSRFSLQFALYL